MLQAIEDLKENSVNYEIAFFGGSFTAIDRRYMTELLNATVPFINSFKGIRISTRPDCIDKEVLDILSSYKVTSIELGAQSMDDSVLKANNRGHSAEDVRNAVYLIKDYGFSLGLQMMTGLYMSDCEKDMSTAIEFVSLKPDTVRIYPTVVLKDTDLAQYYFDKKFLPNSLEESVELCSKLIPLFESNNIKIIRLGLHYSDSLVQSSVFNNYHPAFKELCEAKIFYNSFMSQAKNFDKNTKFCVYINKKSLSKFLGQSKSNLKAFNNWGYSFDIKFDDSLNKYDLVIK